MKQIPQANLKTRVFGKQIMYYDEIDSTNMEAKRHEIDEKCHGMVFLAEQQNQGKGRLGRLWASPKGTGIWMSILLKPDFSPEIASEVTILAALATADAIRKVTKLNCKIKWPNDLVINRKKVCGILTEMIVQDGVIHKLIVGIGINVNTKSFSEDISDKATSLSLEGNAQYSREEIICELLCRLEQYYEEFSKVGSLKNVVNYYNSILISRGKKVKIVEKMKTDIGESLGIDEKGRLMVLTEQGEVRTILSGEVSVRGLYQYVD